MDDGHRHSGFSPGPSVTICRSHGPAFFNVSGHSTVSQTGFFLSLFWRRTSVTIPRTWSVTMVWSLTSKSKILKKKGLTDHGMATGVKKPCLWDRGMAFDIRVQNVLEKKLGLTDRGVATGVTKFHMASGGLSNSFEFFPHENLMKIFKMKKKGTHLIALFGRLKKNQYLCTTDNNGGWLPVWYLVIGTKYTQLRNG